EKSEPAHIGGKASAAAEERRVLRPAACVSGSVEGFPCAALFLGALVHRLQSRRSDHYAIAIRVCPQGSARGRGNAALRLCSWSGWREPTTGTSVHQTSLTALLSRFAGGLGPRQPGEFHYLRSQHDAHACADQP